MQFPRQLHQPLRSLMPPPMVWARIMGKGRLAAFAAILALVLQTMVAAPVHAQGETIQVCTPQGLATISIDHAPAAPDHGAKAHCGYCVLAGVVDTPLVRVSAPARFAYAVAPQVQAKSLAPVHAQGPPRPFGQAPPVS
jgi:hypothetical protein